LEFTLTLLAVLKHTYSLTEPYYLPDHVMNLTSLYAFSGQGSRWNEYSFLILFMHRIPCIYYPSLKPKSC